LLDVSTLSLHDALPISGRRLHALPLQRHHLGTGRRAAGLGKAILRLHTSGSCWVFPRRSLVFLGSRMFRALILSSLMALSACSKDRKSTRLNSSHGSIS